MVSDADFHIEWPDDLDVRAGPRLCAKCKKVFPLRDFDRPLTQAQARHRGHTAAHKVFITSSMCRRCQPDAVQRYAPARNKLTVEEIHEYHARGRISASRAWIDTQKARARETNAQREAQLRRWARVRAQEWTPVADAIRAELERARNWVRAQRGNPYRPLRNWLDAYVTTLRVARARAWLAAKSGTRVPNPTEAHTRTLAQWLDILVPRSPERRLDALHPLVADWEALPVSERARLRNPPLVATSNPVKGEQQ